MSFQLVRASDNEIIVWHTEHGHIYLFEIDPKARELTPIGHRDGPDATQNAESLKPEALAFATQEARSRRYLR